MNAPNLGEILVAADGDALAHIAAHLVRALVSEAARANGVARVAVSGGSTPRAMNRVLRRLEVPWAQTEWFWVDERAVAASNARSNYGAAVEDLFGALPQTPRQIHPMPGGSADLDRAAADYEGEIASSFGLASPLSGGRELPSFDLLLLGIGDDGHTASLFPGDPFVDEAERWVVHVPAQPGREARLSLTRPVITAARRVIVLAQGAAKKGPIEKARGEGPLRDIPSRLTREVRGELIWLIDAAARPLLPD